MLPPLPLGVPTLLASLLLLHPYCCCCIHTAVAASILLLLHPYCCCCIHNAVGSLLLSWWLFSWFENVFVDDQFSKWAINRLVHLGYRLNMELDFQSLFGLHVHSGTHCLRPPQPPPSHLGSYTKALLVSKDIHILVNPLIWEISRLA
jgi:hypothetical protein